MSSKILIDKLFDQLDEWRHFPAYQLERRADIFFAIYLRDIIKGKFNEEIDFIIPEFPIRIGSLYSEGPNNNSNLSFKIDYVAVSNKTKHVYLVELKTDDGSRREKQDKYLKNVQKQRIYNLIDGVIKIYNATNYKAKYDNLISILAQIGWIDKESMKNTSTDYSISIVYIQPNSGQTDKTIITFLDIITYLSMYNDELTQRFTQSLMSWTIKPNK